MGESLLIQANNVELNLWHSTKTCFHTRKFVKNALPLKKRTLPAALEPRFSVLLGTMVETYHCSIPVQELHVGEVVQTLTNGFQPLRTVRSQRLANYVVRFMPRSIGNENPIIVSDDHTFLLTHPEAGRMFGATEFLVKAKHLVNNYNIMSLRGHSSHYYHLSFEEDQIVLANGLPSYCVSNCGQNHDINGPKRLPQTGLSVLSCEHVNTLRGFGEFKIFRGSEPMGNQTSFT